MLKEEIISIATKLSEGIATKEEIALLINHMDKVNSKYSDWEELDPIVKSNIGSEMKTSILKQIQVGSSSSLVLRKSKLWIKTISIAAAIILIITALLLFKVLNTDSSTFAKYHNDVAPGKYGATLTLANGKKIYLSPESEGVLFNQDGIKISKNRDGQIVYKITPSNANDGHINQTNTISTSKGEIYSVILPDQSRVWLNADSKLSYPVSFNSGGAGKSKKSRIVTLEGEGYFEISKDKSHPFVVKTAKQQVEVLGTHFNINSYRNEPEVQTTLLEGRVNVTKLTFPTAMVALLPGQQSNLREVLNVNYVDTANVMAWKNGLFIFKDQPLEKIMRQVERWYNVDVVYQDDLQTKTFWGTMHRFGNVSEVLQILELTQKVHFKIEGRRITVMK